MNGAEEWHVQDDQSEDRTTPAARASDENSGTGIENSQSETGHLHFSHLLNHFAMKRK